MEERILDLERRYESLSRRVDDAMSQSLANGRDIATLTVKIDALRDDIKELKKLGEASVPRSELDHRLSAMNHRMDSLEASVVSLHGEVRDTRSSLSESIHQNTLVTWGNLLALALGIIALLGGFFFNSMSTNSPDEIKKLRYEVLEGVKSVY